LLREGSSSGELIGITNSSRFVEEGI
jgi:hypothetical protein